MEDEIRPNEERPFSYGRTERVVTSETRPAFLKRISWGAVFAGVLIALVVQLILSLLGLGIGFGSIEPKTESNPFAGLATGALVWWVVSMLISLFVGGLTAGRLAGVPRSFDGVLHGLLSFSMFTLISFYLLTTAVGGIISGVGSIVGETLSLAGKGVSAAAPEVAGAVKQEMKNQGIDLAFLKREARQILTETGKPELQPSELQRQARGAGRDVSSEIGSGAENPQNADNTADNIIDKLFSRADKVIDAADRDAAVNVVMKRTGKTRAESEQIVDNWIASYNQAKVKFDTLKSQAGQTARNAGDVVASAASKASIYAFIGLLLGAAAAAVGGNLGRPKEVTVNEEQRRRV
ncbi:MAG: YrzE family protein [Syntrophothermus sp.]